MRLHLFDMMTAFILLPPWRINSDVENEADISNIPQIVGHFHVLRDNELSG